MMTLAPFAPEEGVIRHLWAHSAMKLDQIFTAFLKEHLCVVISASVDDLTSNWHHLLPSML